MKYQKSWTEAVQEVRNLDEATFKVKVEDVGTVFVEAGSEGEVKQNMRKILKPDSFKTVAISKVSKSEMKKMYRSMSQGDDGEEVEEDYGITEDAKMGKQSDDQLKKLYKTASEKDQSSPANKSFTQRVAKEMKKRGISEQEGVRKVDFVDGVTPDIVEEKCPDCGKDPCECKKEAVLIELDIPFL